MAARRALTQRQMDVARGVVHGWSNTAIARELGITPAAVKRDLSLIMAHWGCVNRVDVAVHAVALGLVDGGSRAVQAFAEQVVASAPYPAVLLRLNGGRVFLERMNPAAMRFSEVGLGSNADSVVVEADRPRARAIVAAALRDGAATGRFRIDRPDGTVVTILTHLVRCAPDLLLGIDLPMEFRRDSDGAPAPSRA